MRRIDEEQSGNFSNHSRSSGRGGLIKGDVNVSHHMLPMTAGATGRRDSIKKDKKKTWTIRFFYLEQFNKLMKPLPKVSPFLMMKNRIMA